MRFIKETIISLAAAAAIAVGAIAPAQADGLDTSDPKVKAALDAYMESWLKSNAGKVFEEVQKHLDAEKAKLEPQYAEFVAMADKLIGADAPHHGADVANASVVFVEFFDYNCPFCQQLHKEIQTLQADPALADVAYVYRDLPILEEGTHTSNSAAYAARAAAVQGKFKEFTDLVWTFPSHGVTEEGLVEFAKQSGLDMARFDADRKSDTVKAAVASDLAMGTNLKVHGTPFIFLWSPEHKKGGIIGGMAPAEQLKAMMEALKQGQDIQQ